MISTLTAEERKEPRWFVMHTPVGNLDRIIDRLQKKEEISDVFVPRQTALRKRGSKMKKELVQVMPGYLFVKAPQTALIEFKRGENTLMFSVWTAQYSEDRGQETRYLWIADGEMANFIRVCRAAEDRVEYFKPDEIPFKAGQRIQVIDGGEFHGVTGWFQRVKGHRNRRLVVRLDNLLGASVEIAPDLVRPLPDDGET